MNMVRPKYQIIADEIRGKIVDDLYPIDTTIPTELQLQNEYSVSRHTVRQAIALLVNEGYLRTEKGSGTYVDNKFLTTNSISNGNKTIGVITTYLSDYIFPSIIRGIEQTLRSQGYSLLLASTNNDYGQERECLESMINQGVAGLIVEPTKSNQYNPNIALYASLKEKGIPMVMINAMYEELVTPYIRVNDVQSGFMATEYLINNGHKNVMFVTKIDDLQGKYRMKGFIKACEKYDIPFAPEDIVTYTTETRNSIFPLVEANLKANKKISGIICYNDQIANSLISQLNENGYQVPADISVIGNDNSTLSTVGEVKLTTLEHPKDLLGEAAANWIIKAVNGNEPSENIIYEPVLVERNSVKKIN